MKAFIFDLDGTLTDSMYVWVNADRKFLGKFGIEPDDEYNRTITSLTFTEGVNYIKTRYNIDMTQEEIMNELYNLAYDEYEKNVNLKKGVIEFLDRLKKQGIKLGIATFSIKDMCYAVLKRHDILKYFDTIVFSDDVGVNKTFPDIYIETANRLGEDIKNCVVFEDVPHAAMGAKKSGAFVVGVYDEFSDDKRGEMEKICDKYIDSFDEFVF